MIKLGLSGLPVEFPIQWARQSGKTETHVHTTIALAIYNARWLQREFRIAFLAPSKQEQTVVVTRDRLQMYVSRLMPWLKPILGMDTVLGEGRRTADFIFRASTGIESSVRCVSGAPKAHVKAHTFQLMFLEQVEDMDEEKMKNDIFPFGAGSETGCLTVLAGSAAPKVINNYYYNAIQKQIEETGIKPPWFVDDALAAMYRPGYGKFVAEMRLKIGEDSDAFRTQFGNEWILPRNKLIDRNLLLNLKWHAGQIQFDARGLKACGLDVGKSVDSSVLTYGTRQGERSYIQGWLEKEGTDYEKQGRDFAELIAAQNLQTLEIDATGPGAALADIIEARLRDIPHPCQLTRFMFTSQNNNDLYVQYEKEITHSRVLYPAEESKEQRRFIEQHLDVERIITRNLLNLKAPNRANAHDDYVASAALMVDALLSPSFFDLPVLTRSR
jgi:hypothetical protein